MATYNNKHWLLSHIKNSFISTDDTGICEAVMLSDDLPSSYLQYQQRIGNGEDEESPVKFTKAGLPVEFLCYPGLDENEEDEMDMMTQSYEIQLLGDMSFQRQRSNTAQRLEKMDLARRRASKIRTVKYEDSVTYDPEIDGNLFQKKTTSTKQGPFTSLLSVQIERQPKLPQNKFLEFAKYDGTAQTGIAIRTFKIFLTMLSEKQRNYPLEISVISSAKIEEFIGLICYKCSIQNPEVPLMSAKNYGLYMVEEDGDIDTDFPPLEHTEPCSKFCFNYLALVERRDSGGGDSPSVRLEFPTLSMTSDAKSNAEVALNEMNKSASIQNSDDIRKMDDHNTMIEAPHYRAYRLFIMNKARLKTEIMLGISGEKIEIDPVQTKSTKFWVKQKPVSHSMDSIAWCEKVEQKSNKALFRIVYSLSFGLQQNPETSSPLQPSATFKHYDFEADCETAQEIIDKINNILEISGSASRREYLSARERRQGKALQFKKSK